MLKVLLLKVMMIADPAQPLPRVDPLLVMLKLLVLLPLRASARLLPRMTPSVELLVLMLLRELMLLPLRASAQQVLRITPSVELLALMCW